MTRSLLAWVLFCIVQQVQAQSSISGTITDESGAPLPGAYLFITSPSIQTMTDANGNFNLSSNDAFPWMVEVFATSYVTRTLAVHQAGDLGMINLVTGFTSGDEVIVTISRVPEKVAESAVSVTTLDRRRLEVTPVNGDPTEFLRNVPGVNLVRSGTESSNIELRAPVNVLETSALVLKDYAPLTAASDKILTSVAGSLSPLDIAGIEVLRGPTGIIYGPVGTSGVVHYITKDAFGYPGISAMVSGGEQNLFTSQVRYAGNNGSKWGWKFLANYSQSNDFSIADDELVASDGTTILVTPQNFETLGGKRWENVDNLDAIRLYHWNFEAGIEYRANDKTKLNYTTSLSRALTNITTPYGHSLYGLQRFEQQARLRLGNLFATVYHRLNFGNANALANHVFTFNYTAGNEGGTQFPDPKSGENHVDVALQYRLEINPKLNFQFGTDAKLSPAFESAAYGARIGNNAYNIYGGFASGSYKFGNRLILNAAGRYDYFNAYEKGAFSPQAGLVYQMKRNSWIRFNYSRAYEAPGRERTWMDLNLSSRLPPFFPATRILGSRQQVTYNQPVTRFNFGDVPGGELLDLQDIINAAAAHAGVPAPVVSGEIDPAIVTASYASPMVGVLTGFPTTLMEAVAAAPVLSEVNQLAVGFSHTFRNKFQVTGELFHMRVENIQSSGEVVISAGSQLNLLEISTLLVQQVPASPERNALITSLYSVPPNPTLNPEFNGIPGFGVVMSDRAQQFNYVYDVRYASYNNMDVNYYGADLSTTYFVTPELSLFGNYSWLSQTEWDAADLGVTNGDHGYYLNTAPDRFNLGINYYPQAGIYGSLAMNYQSAYQGRQGDGRFFSGLNEARSMFDLQIGYRLKTRNNVFLDLGLSVNNLFDKQYSHFVNLAQLRRFSALSMKVSL